MVDGDFIGVIIGVIIGVVPGVVIGVLISVGVGNGAGVSVGVGVGVGIGFMILIGLIPDKAALAGEILSKNIEIVNTTKTEEYLCIFFIHFTLLLTDYFVCN